MNLLSVTSGSIGAVNPNQPILWRQSLGYTISANGAQVPQYGADVSIPGQVQPMQFRDLQQVDSLNLQGTRRKVYLFGVKDAIVRSLSKGGDLLVDTAGAVWLVAMVIEQWGEQWCSVAVTLQVDNE